MFRSYTWIVQPCCDGINFSRFTIFVRKHICPETMNDARFTSQKCCRMFSVRCTFSPRFDPCDFDRWVIKETGEKAYSVASSSDTCHYSIRQSSFSLHHLLPCFTADHALEIPYHGGERMRPNCRTKQVEGLFILYPCLKCSIYSFLKGLLTFSDGDDLGAQNIHSFNIRRLANYIYSSHVDFTFHAH